MIVFLKNKILKSFVLVIVLLLVGVEMLRVYDFYTCDQSKLSVPHPIFWAPHVSRYYMYYKLKEEYSDKVYRTWLYFCNVGETTKSRAIFMEWANGGCAQKRARAYFYFWINIESNKHKQVNYELFIDWWSKEQNMTCLALLAERIYLSEIPVDNLSRDTNIKNAYVDSFIYARKNNFPDKMMSLEDYGVTDKEANGMAFTYDYVLEIKRLFPK